MRKVIGESGEVDKARVDIDRIEEPKQVTKKESQRAFEQLLNRFQNSLKFEDKHVDLLNQVNEALTLPKNFTYQSFSLFGFKKFKLKIFFARLR